MNNLREIYISTSSFGSNVLDIKRFFITHGIQAYLVGGAVRDACLNRFTQDLDVIVMSPDTHVSSRLAEALKGKRISLDAGRNIDRIVFENNNLK